MMYMMPLLMSFLMYMMYENENMMMYGMMTLMMNMLLMNFMNNEMIMMIYLSLLIIYFIFSSLNNKDKTLMMLGGMFMMGSYMSMMSTSILSLFISLEILTFTIIIIINLYIQDQYPGMMYYLMSGFMTGMLMLSLGYAYLGYLLSYKLMMMVFIFKLGLIPFHLILPLIYLNLNPNNIFIIDIPYKMVMFYLLMKLEMTKMSYMYMIFLLMISSLASLRYKNLMYMMMYSSMFNYSLILMIMSLKEYTLFLYYMFYYSMFILIYLYLLTNFFINKEFAQSWYLFLWFLLLFNLIGIPPLSGFMMKYKVLYLMMLNNLIYLYLFTCFSILFLSFTYLRILFTMLISNYKYKMMLKNKNYSNLISFLITFISFPLFF